MQHASQLAVLVIRGGGDRAETGEDPEGSSDVERFEEERIHAPRISRCRVAAGKRNLPIPWCNGRLPIAASLLRKVGRDQALAESFGIAARSFWV